MSSTSEVAFAIKGPKDRLEFMQRWAEDLFIENECMEQDELQLWIKNEDTEVWMLCWESPCIKWYDGLPYWSVYNYPEMRQFHEIWSLANKWELDAQMVEVHEMGTSYEKSLGDGIHNLYVTNRITKPW